MRYALLSLLILIGCKDPIGAPDAGEITDPAKPIPQAEANDAGVFIEAPATNVEADDPGVYRLPWRAELLRAAFELRIPMPASTIQITESNGPVRRYRDRRSDLSFFVERRGVAGMPQALPTDDTATWYVQAYRGTDVRGPVPVLFAGHAASRIEFRAPVDDEILYVTVYTIFRGGFVYGVGIESKKPKRVSAAARRIARLATFVGKAANVHVTKAKTLKDLDIILPGAATLYESQGLGGVNLTQRETRMNMLVARVPVRNARWSKTLDHFRDAIEAQNFPGYVLRKSEKVKVGRLDGFAVGYSTTGKFDGEDIYIYQVVTRANGYAYLFTASSFHQLENEVRLFSQRVLKDARFRKPF